MLDALVSRNPGPDVRIVVVKILIVVLNPQDMCCDNRREECQQGQYGYAAQTVVDAIIESLGTGRTVTLDVPNPPALYG